MQSKEVTVTGYIDSLPEDRVAAVQKLFKIIKKNIPKGFAPVMQYGMISFVVPHKLYPAGYHCKPTDALPFLSLASQKNFIAIYHMGLYNDPKLYKWFTEAHAEASVKKLDIGKSCMRYKKPEDIPYDLIGELAAKITVVDWIERYEKAWKPKK
jgi:hypothetical protein